MSFKDSFYPDHYYHIYQKAIGNLQPLTTNAEKIKLMNLLSEYTSGLVRVVAYCLLDNHYHYVIQVGSESEVMKIVAQRKGRHIDEVNVSVFVATQIGHGINAFTKWWNTKQKHVGSVFTPLSRVEIRDEEQLQYTIAYVHRNPIHHRYAKTFKDYPWSSFSKPEMYAWKSLYDSEEEIIAIHEAAYEEMKRQGRILE